MNLRKFSLIIGIAAALVGCVTFLASAQTSASPARSEVAMIKWDGPDKVQLITPDKNEFVRVFKSGTRLPKEGWEPVNRNSTRILTRRPVSR